MKKIIMLLVFLASVLVLSGVANAANVPIDILEVEVDGTELNPGSTTRLDLTRGNNFPVRVELNATDNVTDVQVEAFISGYEYSDFNPISDSTHVFDVDDNVRYTKRLTLSLPENVDEDNYKLRLLLTDKDNQEIIQNYNLKLGVPRHSIAIKDVVFSPSATVQAGRSLLSTIRIENMGEQDEEGIKVKVSIPDLGISAADYIDELESDESTTSEELYMRVPRSAESGRYDAKVTVEYDEGYERIVKDESITVEAVEEDVADDEEEPSGKTVVSLSTTSQDITQGEAGVVYPVTITNDNSASKSYTLNIQGISSFGSVEVSPSNTMVLQGGETGTFYVYVTANQDAQVGENTFVAQLQSSGKVLKEIGLSANIQEAESTGWGQVKQGLEIALVVLVVLLVILGLIIGFSKLKGEREEPSEEGGKTYY